MSLAPGARARVGSAVAVIRHGRFGSLKSANTASRGRSSPPTVINGNGTDRLCPAANPPCTLTPDGSITAASFGGAPCTGRVAVCRR